MKILFVLVALAIVHHYTGTAGLVTLAVVALAYLLLRTRPFTTCTYCRGHGSRTRIFGSPVRCSACSGTGYGTRAHRRNTTTTPPKNRSARR